MQLNLNSSAGTLLSLLAIALALVGFFRSVVSGKKPPLLLSPEKFSSDWFQENSWLSRFSVIFLPLVLIYNLAAWVVYGLISVFDFTGFVFKGVWWVARWIWHEVLHPTIFALFRLLWHYLVVMAWRFFRFAMQWVPSAFNLQHIRFAFVKLLLFALVVAVVTLAWLLTSNQIVLAVGMVIVFFFLQYSVFTTVKHLKSPTYASFHVIGNLKTVAIWFVIAILTSGILYILKSLSEVIIVNGISVTLSQLFIPAAVLFALGVVLSALYLPAYTSETDSSDFQLHHFLKTVLWRSPKLIFATPFKVPGLIVVVLVPLLIGFFLNTGIGMITGKNVQEWTSEIALIGRHIPAIHHNSDAIEINNRQIETYTAKMNKRLDVMNAEYQKLQSELETAKKLKAAILNDQIHSFEGEAYAGETQPFSLPAVSNCSSYEWTVVNTDTKQQLLKSTFGATETSSVLNFTWPKAGHYKVTLSTRNSCGSGDTLERYVTVMNRPEQSPTLQKPSGPYEVCENLVAEYKAPAGFENYEWTLPQGAKIVRKNADNSVISVRWGNTSGPVRVKAVNAQKMPTNWAGIYVNVTPKPGRQVNQEADIEEDIVLQPTITHPAYYSTREVAQSEIDQMSMKLKTAEQEIKATNQELTAFVNVLESKNADLSKNSSIQRSMLIAGILASLGIALLFSLVFATSWLYLIRYDYELFGAEQTGSHYWQQLLVDLQSKNPNQPLLGIFSVLFLAALVWVWMNFSMLQL